MEFHKYSSIENSYQTPYLDKIRSAIALGYIDKDMKWVVTEKVHGANFSVLITETEQRPAKRTSLLSDNENFYGYQEVLSKYGPAFRKIFEYVKERYGSKENPVVLVQCFGEIYGGQYPHPDVEKCKGALLVQKGIWYCPWNEFYGFDIAYTLADETRRFVTQTDMVTAYTSVGIIPAEPLFRGTFEECLEYPNAFQTTIPDILLLPPIENNICEGVVIKPEEDVRLATGDRPLVKNKNDRFKEKCHGPKVLRTPEVLPDEVRELLDILLEYVCENRLMNVLSHIGECDMPRDFGKLIKAFSTDALEDFIKDNHARWDLMEKTDQKKLTKNMTGAAAEVIKDYYKIKRES